MSVIASTCGTSIWTNGASDDERTLLRNTANLKREEVGDTEREALEELFHRQTERLSQESLAKVRKLSAEINGLVAWAGGQPKSQGGDHFILIHTDTWQGTVAAEAVLAWLQTNWRGATFELHHCKDLNTKSYEEFRSSLCDLARWARETFTAYRDAGHEVVFNLTGGFKSMQGFMQALGMVLADRCIYLFEDSSSELVSIPRLPLRLDFGETGHEHAELLRRLDVLGAQPLADCRGLPETLLFVTDDEATLSEWGELAWTKAKDDLYASTSPLEPLLDQIRYHDREAFGKSLAALDEKHRRQVQERLDDFARYLLTRQRIKRLDFKPVHGGQKLPSTHEIDAFADLDAKRIFLHQDEDGVWVIDELGRALH